MAQDHLTLFDLAPGRTFAERFLIERLHRNTGLAPTFLAHDERADEPVCLTVFVPSMFENGGQAEEFRAACQPWTRVKSAHVTKVREIIAAASSVFWVTDVPSGDTLKHALERDRRIDPLRAAVLGIGLLDGLHAIHQVGLVHGDVKPQTVYLETAGKKASAHLVDGGVTPGLWNAKHLGERTALIGTPFYAPVEQFGGESPDVQSDIYNVAAVLFEMVTGVLPWPGKSYLEVFQAKLDRQPPSIKRRAPDLDVSPALEQAIAGGLLADRRERFSSAAEFRAALEAATQRG